MLTGSGAGRAARCGRSTPLSVASSRLGKRRTRRADRLGPSRRGGARRGTSGRRRRTTCAGSRARVAGRAGRRSPQWAGSWFAEPRHVITRAPASIGGRRSRVGQGDAARHLHRAVVAQQLVGDRRVDRRVASRSSSWSRLRSSASMPLPMRFTVVSWPATNSSTTCSTSSSRGEAIAFVLGRDQPVSRSSPGFSRFHAMTSFARCPDVVARDDHSRSRRGSGSGRTSSRPRPTTRGAASRSPPSGMPSISEMIDEREREREIGDDVHSQVPRAAAASRYSSTSCCTRGRSASTSRGVKTFDTSRRSRWWSGGSRLSIEWLPPSRAAPSSLRCRGSTGGTGRVSFFDAGAGSRSTW